MSDEKEQRSAAACIVDREEMHSEIYSLLSGTTHERGLIAGTILRLFDRWKPSSTGERDAIIEECAKVLDDRIGPEGPRGVMTMELWHAAKALRALKSAAGREITADASRPMQVESGAVLQSEGAHPHPVPIREAETARSAAPAPQSATGESGE